MKQMILVIAALTLFGCEDNTCIECVETTTVKFYTSSSSLIKTEDDEVSTLVCDESDVERLDGSFEMTEDDFGNMGYYKVTTIITSCE